MAYLPSLPGDAVLLDVFRAYPEQARPLLDYHQALLRYAGKLTLSPATITPADAEAVLAAGWAEHALHDTVAVCGLFNLMSRLVDGLGITAGEDYFITAARQLAGAGYAGLKDLL
jgi:alkylhydroperoxidase family enzyme